MPARAVSGRPPSSLGEVPVMAVPDDGDAEPAFRMCIWAGGRVQGSGSPGFTGFGKHQEISIEARSQRQCTGWVDTNRFDGDQTSKAKADAVDGSDLDSWPTVHFILSETESAIDHALPVRTREGSHGVSACPG